MADIVEVKGYREDQVGKLTELLKPVPVKGHLDQVMNLPAETVDAIVDHLYECGVRVIDAATRRYEPSESDTSVSRVGEWVVITPPTKPVDNVDLNKRRSDAMARIRKELGMPEKKEGQ